jgi:hypothetical protein
LTENLSASKKQPIGERLSSHGRISIKSGRKLPPIETLINDHDHKDIYESESFLNESLKTQEADVTFQNIEIITEEAEKRIEEPVVEIFIDSLDDIDKPGIFILSTYFPDSTALKITELDEKIEYKNEVHIFMSSFFIGWKFLFFFEYCLYSY